MADWTKITDRGNVEDRRSLSMAVGGGLGLGGIALVLLFSYLQNGSLDVGTVVDVLSQSSVARQTQTIDIGPIDPTYQTFASTVLGSTNTTWTRILAARNISYVPPHFVLFRGGTSSGCGGASSEYGPHYCPEDQTIYLDERFFDELQTRFGGSAGDVAQAYVIAHEVGHHVQRLLGLDATNDSIAVELQADCLAGVWAYSIKDQGVLAPGEIKEALDAASAVGDDNIQQRTTGQVSRETWTHGSSAQRVQAFTKGYTNGTLTSCNI